MKDTSEPAFPQKDTEYRSSAALGLPGHYAEVTKGGLTKREYFAGQALAIFHGHEALSDAGSWEEIAYHCVGIAEALVRELAKSDEGGA